MARGYKINGEAMVSVKGMAGTSIEEVQQLGLSEGVIQITPNFSHAGVRTDDFGTTVPAEMQWMLTDTIISMTLVHYDQSIMETCWREAMAGSLVDGVLIGAGTPMGGGVPVFEDGNHYVSLNIASPQGNYPWNFPTCYLADQPFVMPLGTERTAVQLRWRAIPYVPTTDAEDAVQEIQSAGAIIWTHILDV